MGKRYRKEGRVNCLICANDIYDVFYTTVDSQGNVDTLCFVCYSKNVLDNYQGMVNGGGTKMINKCECGTQNPLGQGHSGWCLLYRKEF